VKSSSAQPPAFLKLKLPHDSLNLESSEGSSTLLELFVDEEGGDEAGAGSWAHAGRTKKDSIVDIKIRTIWFFTASASLLLFWISERIFRKRLSSSRLVLIPLRVRGTFLSDGECTHSLGARFEWNKRRWAIDA
jgi:hypothetical protein